jgi:hypothetical protein
VACYQAENPNAERRTLTAPCARRTLNAERQYALSGEHFEVSHLQRLLFARSSSSSPFPFRAALSI